MLKEFREFISKGSVMDLAIGIIIGAAFTAIVTSFVKDILTPFIALAGKANLEGQFLVLKAGTAAPANDSLAAAQAAGAVTLNYGSFVSAVINFFLVAFVLFILIKMVNKMRREPAPAPPAERVPTQEEVLLGEIRDLLAKRA